MQIAEKSTIQSVGSTEHMRTVDPALWCMQQLTADILKDVRDQRELTLLSKMLGELCRSNQAALADLMAMRIREFKLAKGTDGMDWAKAEPMLLVPGAEVSTSAQMPERAFEL